MAEPSKILLIDDEKDIVNFFSKVFENFKHIDFKTSLSAKDGVLVAKTIKPDVVIMDLRMPGMSGEEALRELKPILPDTHFLVMTGWDDGETKQRITKEFDLAGYFEKPVNLEVVMEKVLELVPLK